MAFMVQYLPKCATDLYQTISNIRDANTERDDKEKDAIELAVLVSHIGIAAGICFAMHKGSLLAAGILAAASFPAAALAGGAMFMKYGATTLATGLVGNQIYATIGGIFTLAIGYGLLDIYRDKKANGLLGALRNYQFIKQQLPNLDRKIGEINKPYVVVAGHIIIAAGICFAAYKGSLLAAGTLAAASFPAAALAGSAMFINCGAVALKTGLVVNQMHTVVGGIFALASGGGLLAIYKDGKSNGLLDVFQNYEFVDAGKNFIVSLLGKS